MLDPGPELAVMRTRLAADRTLMAWIRTSFAMITFGFGIALVTPNLVALAGFVLLVVTIELQVRVVEEPYLLTVHGDAYRDYVANVDRFLPAEGRAR